MDHDKIDTIADAVHMLLDDRAIAQQLGQQARKQAQSTYATNILYPARANLLKKLATVEATSKTAISEKIA